LLLEHPGSVVTREELHARLWPDGTCVDVEHSLNAAVKRLRLALGDEASDSKFIETLPRRGYRFIGGVEAASQPSTPPPAAPHARLAVLPFTDLTPGDGQSTFSDGLTEEAIAQIAMLCRGRLGVVARSSSMAFKGTVRRAQEIGALLSTDYLVEGSVRREGDRVRIAARLVKARDETLLWSDTFDERLVPVLAAQSGGAARIARSLAHELFTS
jgi:TolB-like protein